MQAVILAAGKSTRTYPLTVTRPKPLLKVANKALLEHNLENLNGLVDEVIIVVGYKKDMIKSYIGNKYKNLKIRYVEQRQQLGTGNALLEAESHIKNDFISLYGDDVYSRRDFKNVLKTRYSILVKKVKNPEAFGVVLQKNNFLVDLIEKPQRLISNLVNAGLYKLSKKIFDIIKKLKKSKRGEYELTDAISKLANEEKIYCVTSKDWLPIVYPWDLLRADKVLRNSKNAIGKISKISGIIKNSSIGNNCIIKGNIMNSIIMNKTIIYKNSIIKNSIIGENVYVNGKVLNSVIADNVKLKNIVVKNCKIWSNKRISNKTIEHDAE